MVGGDSTNNNSTTHEQNEKERGPLRLWFRPLTPNPYCVLVVVFIVYGAVQALLAAKRVSGVVT